MKVEQTAEIKTAAGLMTGDPLRCHSSLVTVKSCRGSVHMLAVDRLWGSPWRRAGFFIPHAMLE